jgi:predicted enzyme related to lactoylglutathione lyase
MWRLPTNSSPLEGVIMGRPVVHWELWTKSRDRLSEFYRKVFDWKTESIPGMDYMMVDTGCEGGINGGIMTPQHEGPWPGNMSFYIDVDDLAAYRKRIQDAGGTIVIEEQEVPGMGAFSLFTDPDGRMVGIWKGAAK